MSLIRENLQNAKIYFLPLFEIAFYVQKIQSRRQWFSLTLSCVLWIAWDPDHPNRWYLELSPTVQAHGCSRLRPLRPFTHTCEGALVCQVQNVMPSSWGGRGGVYKGDGTSLVVGLAPKIVEGCDKSPTSSKNTVLLYSISF